MNIHDALRVIEKQMTHTISIIKERNGYHTVYGFRKYTGQEVEVTSPDLETALIRFAEEVGK